MPRLLLIVLVLAACGPERPDAETSDAGAPDCAALACPSSCDASGTPRCTCAEGFRDVRGDGQVCEPIPPCADGLERVDGECRESDGCAGSPCFAGVACFDVEAPGTGHTCDACPEGTTGDGTTCVDDDGCAEADCFPGVSCTDVPAPGSGYACGPCPAGTSGDGTTCEEIDGCAEDPCFEGVSCTDVTAPGTGFTCAACPPGLTGDGVTCTDVDECEARPGPCDPLVSCTNSYRGYACGACPAGYVGDGFTCVDRNECTEGLDACDPVAPCVNEPGGYHCGACPSGYADAHGDGTLCADLNECAGENGGFRCAGAGRCINLPGRYRCTCPDAADADAVDVDENGVSDCVETLVRNAQFTTDLAGWSTTFNVRRESWAALLWPTNREGAWAKQCLPAAPDTTYAWWLQLRRDSANGGYGGYGGLTLQASSTADCSDGALSGSSMSTWPEPQWMTLHDEFTTPSTTRALLVTLTSTTPYTNNPVLMDNVLVRVK